MAGKLIVGDTEYEIPDEDDLTLGEVAEFSKLRDEFGGVGATIAMVWIARHRVDPTYTLEQARMVKVGEVSELEAEDDADPLAIPAPPENATGGAGNGKQPAPSENLVGSGTQ